MPNDTMTDAQEAASILATEQEVTRADAMLQEELSALKRQGHLILERCPHCGNKSASEGACDHCGHTPAKLCDDLACKRARSVTHNRIVEEFAALREFIHELDRDVKVTGSYMIEVQTVRDRLNPIRRRLAAIVNL